jgi:hypothetical protein
MTPPNTVSLNHLALSHDDQIIEIQNAIRGVGVLWTSKMRATVRGGKPCGTSRIDKAEA